MSARTGDKGVLAWLVICNMAEKRIKKGVGSVDPPRNGRATFLYDYTQPAAAEGRGS